MGINENFQFYSDYYAFIAEAGLNRARALYPAIAISSRIDITTIPIRPIADIAKANLTRNFDLAYESVWQEGYSISSFQGAFNSLSKYILESTGQDIDTFLSTQGIKVESTYATLANIFGEEIENSNRKST